MHKYLLAFCASSVTPLCSAQSTTTIFGVIDMSISRYTNSERDLVTRRKTTKRLDALNQKNVGKSHLGFRSSEDLGGGLQLGIWLQAGTAVDDGSEGLDGFRDRSIVSLSGPFGEIRFGRDYTLAFGADSVIDPFVGFGNGVNLLSAANALDPLGNPGGLGGIADYMRASNSASYLLPPNLGGFHGQLMYALGEDDDAPGGSRSSRGRTKADRYAGVGLAYADGPLLLAGTYSRIKVGGGLRDASSDKVRFFTAIASYDFGIAKLVAEYSRSKASGGNDMTASASTPLPDIGMRGYLAGLTVPVGAGMLRASYARVRYDGLFAPGTLAGFGTPRVGKWAIGYVHNLSKRTALYANLMRLTNHDGTRLSLARPFYGSASAESVQRRPGTSTGFELGLRHFF
ncbi:porin [Variovorax paradoxus]|uniref:porin n=1 Tax=Variovorax paradoxus TaxID=34073 RepID=UPI001ABC77FF